VTGKSNQLTKTNCKSLKVGDKVKTMAGDRLTKIKYCGTVIRFTKWRDFEAAVVRRDGDGLLKTYLVKNLVNTERFNNTTKKFKK
jgi:ribosomal protein L19